MPHGEDRIAGWDGVELYCQQWLPEREPVGAVVVQHGFCEHSGRYARLAAALNQQGYAVYAMDLRGHGRSGGPRVYVDAFDDYVTDLEALMRRVRGLAPRQPTFLFGHSLGGAIATLYAITRQPELAGLILSGPAIEVGSRVFPLLRRLAGFMSRLAPRLRLVRFGSRHISRDPQVVADFDRDPLVFHGRFPVRTGAEILRAAGRIRANLGWVRVPLLILHGTSDFSCEARGSQRLLAEAGSSDKTLHLYDGLYHEVLSDPERDHVLGDLLAWLKAHDATTPRVSS